MKKLWALKVRKGPKRGKKQKKSVLQVGIFFFLAIFSLLIFLCTSKMISRAWGSTLITF
jgi:hypothetical protein